MSVFARLSGAFSNAADSGVREWLNSKGGKYAAAAGVVLAVAVCVFAVRSFLHSIDPIGDTTQRVFVDIETGETFTHRVERGEMVPVESPYTGRKTGFDPERCYWNADGTYKEEPTFVVLNRYKNIKGPTFCPDCGRLVSELNNPPFAGATPPPTEVEYAERRGDRAELAGLRGDENGGQ